MPKLKTSNERFWVTFNKQGLKNDNKSPFNEIIFEANFFSILWGQFKEDGQQTDEIVIEQPELSLALTHEMNCNVGCHQRPIGKVH